MNGHSGVGEGAIPESENGLRQSKRTAAIVKHLLTPAERRKGGKASAWRKCWTCGKMVGYADLESGKAKSNFYFSYDFYADDVVENNEITCARCVAKAEAVPANSPPDPLAEATTEKENAS